MCWEDLGKRFGLSFRGFVGWVLENRRAPWICSNKASQAVPMASQGFPQGFLMDLRGSGLHLQLHFLWSSATHFLGLVFMLRGIFLLKDTPRGGLGRRKPHSSPALAGHRRRHWSCAQQKGDAAVKRGHNDLALPSRPVA